MDWLTGFVEGEDAVVAFRAAILADPHSINSYNELGLHLHKLNRLEEASRVFSSALALRPQVSALLNNAAMVANDLGDGERASEMYLAAFRLDPRAMVATLQQSCELKASLGKTKEAIVLWDAASAIQPALHHRAGISLLNVRNI